MSSGFFDKLNKLADEADKLSGKFKDTVDRAKKEIGLGGNPSGSKPANNNKPPYATGLEFPAAPMNYDNFDPDFDANEYAQKILESIKKNKMDVATQGAEFLNDKIDFMEADVRKIDMKPIVKHMTSLYSKKSGEETKQVFDWVNELVIRGADMEKIETDPIRKQVQKQLDKKDFDAARRMMDWVRYVEKAVTDSTEERKRIERNERLRRGGGFPPMGFR